LPKANCIGVKAKKTRALGQSRSRRKGGELPWAPKILEDQLLFSAVH
jgi:hypothetical protein